MTIFENLKSKNIDEFAEWLDNNYETYSSSPWMIYWDKNYCNKCESIINSDKKTWGFGMEYAWCELHSKCKFFPDMDDTPDSKDIIKLWLESEVEDGMEVI